MWLFFLGFVANSFALLGALTMILYISLGKPLFGGDPFYGTHLEFISWLGVTASFLVVPILGFVLAKISYRLYRYELTDAGFRKECGSIIRRQTIIPYNHIQNVDINRNVAERILGLHSLNVRAARKMTIEDIISDEGRLPGLSKEVAEELRDEILRRAQQAKSFRA